MSTLLADEIVNPPLTMPIEEKSHGDTLALGVVILLVMTVAQRLIGFGRGVLFCRWLTPEQLGEWDVAFGFLNLAAPLVVLGLPGSYGRYLEYYRQRGQLRTFLIRTTTVTTLAAAAATLFIVWKRDWVSRLIFNTDAHSDIVLWLAVCLGFVVLHNSLTSLFVALRVYRVVTALQFAQSLGFAVFSVALLATWNSSATSVVMGYAAATLVSALFTIGWLRNRPRTEPVPAEPLPQRDLWAKLLPFAIWMWITNLLANLFEVIDRYMIVHFSGLESSQALAEVGDYHSSRIIPSLFVGVLALLGSLITPHVSQDWELGRRDAVVRRLNLSLKLILMTLFAASLGVLCLAPTLFSLAFGHKYDGGLAVLPCTLAYCAWFGTMSVAQNYLWCAERPGLSSLPYLLGLVLNIGLNLILLPRYGLQGAVWATTAANLTTLTLTYQFSRWHGMQVDLGTWVFTLAPASLCLGLVPAAVLFCPLMVVAMVSPWLFMPAEKAQILNLIHAARDRIGLFLGRCLSQAAPVPK